MRCQNCGFENDVDAKFCENCGSNIRKDSYFGRSQQRTPEKEGMASSTKLLIVVIVVLVAVLGIAAGALMQNNKAISPTNTPVSVTQSPEQVTYKADWHQVTSFSGVVDGYRSFSIKGQRFKVVMSATPTLNYNSNWINVFIQNSNDVLTSGNLNWGANDALTSKEKTIEFSGPSGTYSCRVATKDIQSWTVTVYDYY